MKCAVSGNVNRVRSWFPPKAAVSEQAESGPNRCQLPACQLPAASLPPVFRPYAFSSSMVWRWAATSLRNWLTSSLVALTEVDPAGFARRFRALSVGERTWWHENHQKHEKRC
jgi:hypothetical protein